MFENVCKCFNVWKCEEHCYSWEELVPINLSRAWRGSITLGVSWYFEPVDKQ